MFMGGVFGQSLMKVNPISVSGLLVSRLPVVLGLPVSRLPVVLGLPVSWMPVV